jgi:hypothetical protein
MGGFTIDGLLLVFSALPCRKEKESVASVPLRAASARCVSQLLQLPQPGQRDSTRSIMPPHYHLTTVEKKNVSGMIIRSNLVGHDHKSNPFGHEGLVLISSQSPQKLYPHNSALPHERSPNTLGSRSSASNHQAGQSSAPTLPHAAGAVPIKASKSMNEIEDVDKITVDASSPSRHTARDATDALAQDAVSHGQRKNPLRLAEQRQRHVALSQHESGQQANRFDKKQFSRDVLRADAAPAASVGSHSSPYSLPSTVSRDAAMLQHGMVAPMLTMKSNEAAAVAEYKADRPVQRPLRQVASESAMRIRPARHRFDARDMLKPQRRASEEDIDVPEHESITQQARLLASEISDHIIPRVVQLDASLGHNLNDAFQHFVALHRQLALLAKQQYARAENAHAKAIRAEALADESRLQALRCDRERETAASSKALCDSKILRMQAEAQESALRLQAMSNERDLEKELMHEAMTAAQEAQLARRTADKESRATFQKLLDLRELYEATLVALRELQSKHSELEEERVSQMGLSEQEIFDELKRENRSLKDEVQALRAENSRFSSMFNGAEKKISEASSELALQNELLGAAEESLKSMEEDKMLLHVHLTCILQELHNAEGSSMPHGTSTANEEQWSVALSTLAAEVTTLEKDTRAKLRLQGKLDKCSTQLSLARKEIASLQKEIASFQQHMQDKDDGIRIKEEAIDAKESEVAKHIEKLQDETRKRMAAEKALRIAEKKFAAREADFLKKLKTVRDPVEVNYKVLKSALREMEAELYRALFTLGKNGFDMPAQPHMPKPIINKLSSHTLVTHLATTLGCYGDGVMKVEDPATKMAKRWAAKRRASPDVTLEPIAMPDMSVDAKRQSPSLSDMMVVKTPSRSPSPSVKLGAPPVSPATLPSSPEMQRAQGLASFA